MTEIALGVALISLGVALVAIRRAAKVARAFSLLVKALENLLKALSDQASINEAQQQMNTDIATNLEILGVHTRLIKPSIGFEATQFLAWHNKQKEQRENGEI
jgi:phage regulator Rha-like protein